MENPQFDSLSDADNYLGILTKEAVKCIFQQAGRQPVVFWDKEVVLLGFIQVHPWLLTSWSSRNFPRKATMDVSIFFCSDISLHFCSLF